VNVRYWVGSGRSLQWSVILAQTYRASITPCSFLQLGKKGCASLYYDAVLESRCSACRFQFSLEAWIVDEDVFRFRGSVHNAIAFEKRSSTCASFMRVRVNGSKSGQDELVKAVAADGLLCLSFQTPPAARA
jgi:hypothetical protein